MKSAAVEIFKIVYHSWLICKRSIFCVMNVAYDSVLKLLYIQEI